MNRSALISCERAASPRAVAGPRLASPRSSWLAPFAVAAALLGCGGAPTTASAPSNATADAPSSGLVITETAAQPWRRYDDALGGFSVMMPSEPRVLHGPFGKSGGDVRSLAVSDHDPHTADFAIDRFLSGNPQGPADPALFADVITKSWKKTARREAKDRHGIATVELEGETPEGKVLMCVAASGTNLYVLSVTSGDRFEAELAERFFDSLRLDTPWRIETFAEDSFTVAIPAAVATTVIPPRDGTEIFVYYFHGDADVWIGVTMFTLAEERLRSASLDEILDDGVSGLAHGQGVTIDKVVPFVHRGLRGREVMHTTKTDQVFRSRLFVVGHRGFHVSVSSKDPSVLTSDLATRVLDSIRIGATP